MSRSVSFSAWEGGTDRERRLGGDVRERKKTISVYLRKNDPSS
jgi:hypothetical protein